MWWFGFNFNFDYYSDNIKEASLHMNKIINRKIVCSILLKDDNNIYHRLFQVEGDKNNDQSLYIVRLNHVNNFSVFDESKYREFCLQKTIHSRIGDDGLVQSHMKRSNNIFGVERCFPLNKLNYIFDYGLSPNDSIDKYPVKIPEDNDILIKSKAKYLSDYRFVFYKGEDLLSKNILSQDLFILHKNLIPTINTNGHMFALAIKLSRLIEIQSLKNND